jgi:chromosome segregation ATPase
VFQDGAFEASLGTLRDALDRANERADAAEQGREVLREQIATLRADLSEAQDAADRHHAEAQAAQERADRAEGVRDSALEAANRADAEAAAARGRLADMERDNHAQRALGRLAREGMTNVVGHNCAGRSVTGNSRRSSNIRQISRSTGRGAAFPATATPPAFRWP